MHSIIGFVDFTAHLRYYLNLSRSPWCSFDCSSDTITNIRSLSGNPTLTCNTLLVCLMCANLQLNKRKLKHTFLTGGAPWITQRHIIYRDVLYRQMICFTLYSFHLYSLRKTNICFRQHIAKFCLWLVETVQSVSGCGRKWAIKKLSLILHGKLWGERNPLSTLFTIYEFTFTSL